MLFNIFVGFVIPWVAGIIIYYRNEKLIIFIAPFACAIGFAVDALGASLRFWELAPHGLFMLSGLPYNLGILSVYPCLWIYAIGKLRLNAYLVILITSLIATAAEFAALHFGWITYGNGWNIAYTYFSYFIPALVIYQYYKSLHHFVEI